MGLIDPDSIKHSRLDTSGRAWSKSVSAWVSVVRTGNETPTPLRDLENSFALPRAEAYPDHISADIAAGMRAKSSSNLQVVRSCEERPYHYS